MNKSVFLNISRIIERDSKVSTYKFALLRGTIDLIQENSPFITFRNGRVHIPTGLLILKWLEYYYPLLSADFSIPQNFGSKNLAFETSFKRLIRFYRNKGGFSAFFNDLKNKGFSAEAEELLLQLIRELRKTITKMPMKYIGRSVSDDFYSIYQLEKPSNPKIKRPLIAENLISGCGTYSIPRDYFDAFQLLGSFMNGQDSILFKWAEFSTRAEQSLTIPLVLKEILTSPVTSRDIAEAKRIYRIMLSQTGKVHCVWTGRKLSTYDIDHIVPFSVWRNNDLWNLLPSSSAVNNKKRDKIPDPNFIEMCKDRIFYFWGQLMYHQPEQFTSELRVSLIGDVEMRDWEKKALSKLKSSCDYLIKTRGFEAWST